MGKFYDKLMQKLAEIELGRQAPAPDFTVDSREPLEYIKKQNALNYREEELGFVVKRALLNLSPEKRRQYRRPPQQRGMEGEFLEEPQQAQRDHHRAGKRSCRPERLQAWQVHKPRQLHRA